MKSLKKCITVGNLGSFEFSDDICAHVTFKFKANQMVMTSFKLADPYGVETDISTMALTAYRELLQDALDQCEELASNYGLKLKSNLRSKISRIKPMYLVLDTKTGDSMSENDYSIFYSEFCDQFYVLDGANRLGAEMDIILSGLNLGSGVCIGHL